MTPFAYFIHKHYKAAKEYRMASELIREAVSFEISDLMPSVEDIYHNVCKSLVKHKKDEDGWQTAHKDLKMIADLQFLPAPNTWIEFREWSQTGSQIDNQPPGRELNRITRRGVYLFHEDKEVSLRLSPAIYAIGFNLIEDEFLGCDYFAIKLAKNENGHLSFTQVPSAFIPESNRIQQPTQSEKQRAAVSAISLNIILSLINTPNLLHREKRTPTKNAQRLARERWGTEAPSWHEVIIEHNKGNGSGKGHAGPGAGKALHFVRAHVRLLGTGVYTKVRSHWRGDPSLGASQSKYKVKA